ncbi:hypothetical protein MHYP_G00272150 [Metynnis hypsauchen]
MLRADDFCQDPHRMFPLQRLHTNLHNVVVGEVCSANLGHCLSEQQIDRVYRRRRSKKKRNGVYGTWTINVSMAMLNQVFSMNGSDQPELNRIFWGSIYAMSLFML